MIPRSASVITAYVPGGRPEPFEAIIAGDHKTL
jgi:hypothetical protein